VTGRYAVTPPTPDEITRAALNALGPGEAGWLVGGCLRDELLGRRVRDVDMAVDGRPEPLARALADRFGGEVYSTSDVFGTWRVIVGDLHIDVAALRGGPPGGPPDRETRPLRLEADLRARDVTVDALARPLDGDDIVDPLGGLSDLAAGRLRLCSPASLDDDPLRVLRLARLARVFELVPEAAATEAALRAAPGLARVSGERVRDELCAVLGTRAAPLALRDLAVWGALSVVLPEVDTLRGVEQNPYHHRDVFEHTLEGLTYITGVVAQLGGRRFLATPEEAGLSDVEPLVPVSWAVLLHDIGKPVVRVVDERGRVIFWHHDETGRRMCAEIGRRFNFSSRFVEYVGTLVRQHLRLGFLTREQPLTRRALARYRRDVSPWVFESVVVSLCDRLATRGEKTSLTSMARHYRLARTVWTEVNKVPAPQLLSGDDVMQVLGIEPGPTVGRALDALEEEIEAGEVTDAEGARTFLLEWWGRVEASGGAAESPRVTGDRAAPHRPGDPAGAAGAGGTDA
jgi:tRNA nucleotidyltransferase/poly(A) polymerase